MVVLDPKALYSLEELAVLFDGQSPPRNLRQQLERQGIRPLRLRRGQEWLELWPGRALLEPRSVASVPAEASPPPTDLNFDWD